MDLILHYLPLPEGPTAPTNSPLYDMAALKILTWNVRGLSERAKLTAVLSHLKSQRADISILVETHLTGQKQLCLKKPWEGWLYQAPHTSNSRGIAILVAKTVQFQLHTLQLDPQGQTLFLHATVGGLEILLMAFYIPPPNSICHVTTGCCLRVSLPLGAGSLGGGLQYGHKPTLR